MEGTGPRIYNLFPLLIGPVRAWRGELPHIAALNFNWVYLNPFHYPGFSGSLYAIKDPYRLNDLFADGGDADTLQRDFTAAARSNGLRVMLDLVVNHTARDAVLADEHPDWYRRDLDGDLYSPRAVDPDDPDNVTVWGDLAELDYETPRTRDGLIDYWSRYLRHMIDLGFSGFRCDAAYQLPAQVWAPLIETARAVDPAVRFFAETLGCTTEQVQALETAGFDFLFNSSKWWNFRAGWLLEQYNAFRDIAPSVAFPESHDTPRLAAEVEAADRDALIRHYRLRYLLAACFSTGVMMPVGYEYAFQTSLDVVETRPQDWEDNGIDLSAWIAAVNAMKAAASALNEEGPQRRVTAPSHPLVGLLRTTHDGRECALTVINPDTERSHALDGGRLLSESGGVYRFTEVTPKASPVVMTPGRPLRLEPLQARVFRGERRATRRHRAPRSGVARLERLAEGRVVIEAVRPQIDGGRHPVKRIVGDVLNVHADVFADGHEQLAACVRWRDTRSRTWHETPMMPVDNDRWHGEVPLSDNSRYRYTIEAWRDRFATWRDDFVKKRDAEQSVELERVEGCELVAEAMDHADGNDQADLSALLSEINAARNVADRDPVLLSERLSTLMHRAAPRANLTRYRRELEVVVDRTAARFAAWYEVFPRSTSGDAHRHGTFDDLIAHLPYVREMGFDVLYLPPIHPIGASHRKGRNNALEAGPDDPGSPWAIGSAEGGHTAIHPELGTLDDFKRLVAAARDNGLEVALDFAIQCSRDHPWIEEHPEWFDWRPDGSIQYAENPPKQYQDIVNLHFYGNALPSLWYALRDVMLFWIRQGVTIFRVDNPHTKPVPFWEWLIGEVHARHPDVILLAEAFTRPKMMKKLAKLGFSQSYTYFTWRNTKAELTDYLIELTQDEPAEYLRPNFFVNTPDINPPILQTGGRPAFLIRATLAATLSSVWGIYSGFELCEATPIEGTEEYLDAEKYQLKARNFDQSGHVRHEVARLNRIRQDNPALHELTNLRFHPAHDDSILFYGKRTGNRDNIVWVAVNVDPHHAHEADIELPLYTLGLDDHATIEVENLLDGEQFRWHGKWQRVRLEPSVNPCAIWRLSGTPSPSGGGV